MKIKITLKDPDGVYDCMNGEAAKQASQINGLTDAEREQIAELRLGQIKDKCSPWIEYGECVTIEIDTDFGAARVCLTGGT